MRYAIIAERLRKLGYFVVGNVFNTADFGPPQQRRRAWIFCVRRSNLKVGGENRLIADMDKFKMKTFGLDQVVDLDHKHEIETCTAVKFSAKDTGAKWQDGFERMCEYYGKAFPVNIFCFFLSFRIDVGGSFFT